MVNIEVKKRDGSLEPFNIKKIKRVVIAAGLSEKDGVHLADEVNAWAHSLNEQVINSAAIRDKVYEELKNIKLYSANLFAWYEKTKEKNS